MTLCVELNFAQSFLLNKKVEFEPSFLPIGKLGKKTSPVDCEITVKINTFAPKIKFTQTVAWHGIRVKTEINKFYLETSPVEQCVASVSEEREFRRCEEVLPMIVRCVERKPRFRGGVWAAKIFCPIYPRKGTLSIPKSGGIRLQVEVNNHFPTKTGKKIKKE